jgi:hypothetical protein
VCHRGPCTPKSEIWPPNLNYGYIRGPNAPESVSLDNVAASVEGGSRDDAANMQRTPSPLYCALVPAGLFVFAVSAVSGGSRRWRLRSEATEGAAAASIKQRGCTRKGPRRLPRRPQPRTMVAALRRRGEAAPVYGK